MSGAAAFRSVALAAVIGVWLAGSSGCGATPVAPRTIDLTGVWTGALPLHMPDEDWSLARVPLQQTGNVVAGEIISRNDVHYPVAGEVSGAQGTLAVCGLPGTSTCASIQLLIESFEFTGGRAQRVLGSAIGRCYGTVAGDFVLTRAH